MGRYSQAVATLELPRTPHLPCILEPKAWTRLCSWWTVRGWVENSGFQRGSEQRQ